MKYKTVKYMEIRLRQSGNKLIPKNMLEIKTKRRTYQFDSDRYAEANSLYDDIIQFAVERMKKWTKEVNMREKRETFHVRVLDENDKVIEEERYVF